MNQDVTQLLTQRLGLTQEEYLSLHAGNPAQLFASRFSEQFSDPLLATMFNSMFQQNFGRRDDVIDQDDHGRASESAEITIRKLKEDLAAADTMAHYIAEVFGACPQCWGLNRLCPQCNGRGNPGSGEPQEDEMLAWVTPALAKLGLKVSRMD